MTNEKQPEQEQNGGHYIAGRVAPHFLWIVVLLMVFFVLGPDLFREKLKNATSISVATLEIEFPSEIEEKGSGTYRVEVPEIVRKELKLRFEKLLSYVSNSRILWADDNPLNNLVLIEFLAGLGVVIDLARDLDETCSLAKTGVYDVVFSDMGRSPTQYQPYDPKGGLGSIECAQ